MNKKSGSLLAAIVVFLIVAGYYGQSVMADLNSWNDWDKPAEVAKMWKAGIFGLAAAACAGGLPLKDLLGPFGSWLPGNTTSPPDKKE